MPWLLALQAFLTLALTVACVSYAKRAGEDSAALWKGLAERRIEHNALFDATANALKDVGDALEELELELAQDPIQAEAAPICKRCRAQRKLAVN